MPPHIPRRLLLELAAAMLSGRRRPLLQDARRLLDGLPRAPIVHGREHMPPTGGLVVLANHYQRRDLWIGWAGALLIEATGRPIRWLVLRELRLAGRELPLTRRLFSRVAATYGFIPLPAGPTDLTGQATAIRRAIRLLRSGEVVGLFPEGERGHAGRLSPALPGTPELARLLSRFAPLLPAAVWEDGDRLAAAIAPPFRLNEPDPHALMQPIAQLLPSSHR